LYALIIGINDYSSLPKLAGAVNDAKAMEEFLKSRMNVPPGRIRCLLDHDASRQKIVNALRQLSKEKKIETDDLILIYYAGHGAQLEVPFGWEAGRPGHKIQGICPCDYKKVDVHPIPDRTIGAFLDLICKNKGNNITVIFDCCYSASGTR
ncbi:peptidase C14, caspase domain-containing protein, partial [Flammula alnicola]